jgi:hypothetical protein
MMWAPNVPCANAADAVDVAVPEHRAGVHVGVPAVLHELGADGLARCVRLGQGLVERHGVGRRVDGGRRADLDVVRAEADRLSRCCRGRTGTQSFVNGARTGGGEAAGRARVRSMSEGVAAAWLLLYFAAVQTLQGPSPALKSLWS